LAFQMPPAHVEAVTSRLTCSSRMTFDPAIPATDNRVAPGSNRKSQLRDHSGRTVSEHSERRPAREPFVRRRLRHRPGDGRDRFPNGRGTRHGILSLRLWPPWPPQPLRRSECSWLDFAGGARPERWIVFARAVRAFAERRRLGDGPDDRLRVCAAASSAARVP
jgi:hypothetical protein